MRGTRAIIHLDRLTRNIQAVRNRIGPGRLMCLPVKADAYGHGAVCAARAALAAGVRYLAVAAVQEGALLRKADIDAPVLLLSVPLPEEFSDVIAHNLIPLVTDRELAAGLALAAAEAGKRLPVHLKIDTGMGRVGVTADAAAELAAFINAEPSLEYAGTATHLAVSNSTAEDDIHYTKEQLARFQGALEAIRQTGVKPGIVHAANSGAVLLHEDAWFDMVRPGIMIYGYSPAEAGAEMQGSGESLTGTNSGAMMEPLEPVMELESRIVYLKKVHKGETISYGRAWTAPADTWIATIPVGYGDGLPRRLGGRYSVRIRDSFYPLVGRICMDQCMVNLGPETDIRRWEPVTVFGGGGHSAAAIAEELDTIPYEITCNINKRVPRVYMGAIRQWSELSDAAENLSVHQTVRR
ncbi:alanine racemase [Spirochaetia bacterium]|nr:alanine racemase [Spirochaetia bacterium]